MSTRDTPQIEELSAVLGGAYWNFLHARVERRSGRRGKVYGCSCRDILESAIEMAPEIGADALRAAIEHLGAHDRADIERALHVELDEAGGDANTINVVHEWTVFLASLGRLSSAGNVVAV